LTAFLDAPPLRLPPAQLTPLLLEQSLDAALIPSITALHNPQLNWVPHIAIGSYGKVLSVILHHRVPVEKISTIAIDQESRTSVALAEIIFRIFLNQSITFLPESSPGADAQLWIGDRALAQRQAHPHLSILDLGETWTQHTQLPFVYAAWATHPHLSQKEKKNLSSILQKAAQEGIKARHQLAATPIEADYLLHHIRYTLDSKAIEGWQRFLHYAATLQNQPPPAKINFI
jgi:chorismate dehydratase